MNRHFVNALLVVMLVALLIMTVTGLMSLLGIKNPFAMGLHQTTGLIFIALIVVHIITFRKVAYNFLFGSRNAK